MAYAQARKDFEYLETINHLDDWVEIQGDILTLMQNPTKKEAENFYERCIGLWFQEAYMQRRKLERRTKTIKDRYGY